MRVAKSAKVALLERVPLFAGCSRKELADIALIADELDVREGRVIIREGARGHEFFVVLDGTARVTRKGKRIGHIGEGEWAGEIALVSNVPRTATVTAVTPLRLLVVTDRDFQRLIRTKPSIASKILQTLGERLGADERA